MPMRKRCIRRLSACCATAALFEKKHFSLTGTFPKGKVFLTFDSMNKLIDYYVDVLEAKP